MDKPIVAREIRKVYAGRVFTVQVETIDLPRGGEMQVEIVRHPGSVVIIPITNAGDVILVRQYRHAIGQWAWELPAGTLKSGEDLEKAAVRECHEEIQLIPGHVERLGSFYATPGYCDEDMTFYLATELRQPREEEKAQPDEDEDIETRAFPREALRSMIASGEIVDMKTAVGMWLLNV